MTKAKVDVHELIAWDLDEYAYRNATTGDTAEDLDVRIKMAKLSLAERAPYVSDCALLEDEPRSVTGLLNAAAQREDLKEEYAGFDWRLGLVDLHCLLAFQRRLVFDRAALNSVLPRQDDWAHLISLSIGRQRNTNHTLIRNESQIDSLDVSLSSSNPDLQLRLHRKSDSNELSCLSLYGGSPFFEVAEFRGRWFLRDGYHRAYSLMRAGVHRIPAVVIYTRSMEELGATEPWFFGEEQIFSERPPRVTDFIEESMVLRYARTALRKVIRVRIEESLEPADEIEDVQGERL